MLLVKSKFKIAKRLGAAVFEKTQSQKFALSDARAKKNKKPKRGGSDYGRQLLEKQKVRYLFGLSERQLSNYAHAAFEEKDPSTALHQALETRADSVVYHAGFATTRRAARQIVSHGHITVNGTRITTPSHKIKAGDVVAIRDGSRSSALFAGLANPEGDARRAIPAWIDSDMNTLRATITELPVFTALEGGTDYATVFEFYSR